MKNNLRCYSLIVFDEHPPHRDGPTMERYGYIFEFCPGHPLQNRWGWVAQHRLIAETKIGRRLLRQEIVHHIDENPLNNHPDNLQIMSQSEHRILHARLNAQRMRLPLTHESVSKALEEAGSLKGAARALKCHTQTLRNRFPDLCKPYQRRSPTRIDDPRAIALVLKYAPDPKVGLREVVAETGMSAMTALRIAEHNGIKWVKKSRKGEKHRTYRGRPVCRT